MNRRANTETQQPVMTATERRARSKRVDEEVLRARGGVSPLGVLTGILVALGVLVIVGALLGGAVAASDVDSAGEAARELGNNFTEAGIAAAVVFVMAQFLAYLWGGYTAGRMGRGSGFANGLLVPLAAMIVISATVAIATAMGAEPGLALPFLDSRLPVSEEMIVESSAVLGIATILAMLLGGIVGGVRGAGWHSRLEARRLEESGAVDLRDGGILDRRVVEDDSTDADVDRTEVVGPKADDTVVVGSGSRPTLSPDAGQTRASAIHGTPAVRRIDPKA